MPILNLVWFVQFVQPNEFPLASGALNRLQLLYQPLQLGAASVIVHAVDVSDERVVGAWRVGVNVALPDIARTYDMVVPVRKPVNKVCVCACVRACVCVCVSV